MILSNTIFKLCCIEFQFILHQAVADDEASTRLLQILLFLLLSTASLMFIPCAARSSFTLSIYFFGCLPLLLVPSTCPYSATAGSLLPSILVTCPNHISLLFPMLSISISCPSSILVISFRILYLLDLPSTSAASSSLPPVSSFRPFFLATSTRTRTLSPAWQMFCIVSPWLLLLYRLASTFFFTVPNIAEARPILHFMSLVQWPSSVITPTR